MAKRHPALIPLSREHHDGLLLAWRLQQQRIAVLRLWSHEPDWQRDYTLDFFNNYLNTHFKVEENILFKAASKSIPSETKIITKLVDEHKKMRAVISLLENTTERKLPTLLKKFGKMLEKHIRAEERKFFPLCQNEIPENIMISIGKQIESVIKSVTKK